MKRHTWQAHVKNSVIKFIAPINEEAPAKCKLKIAKSTEAPECACIEDKGGYTVQPVPGPTSTKADNNNKIKEGGNKPKTNII